jgi:alpha-ribazole phosphatase
VTRLWLVRHGQTAWNLEGRYQGQADPPLNPTGWEQAQALRGQLAGQRFEAVYSSDLQRALTTARVLADSLGLPVRAEPGLREIRLGEWEGLLQSEIETRYAEAWLSRRADPVRARAPGGESAEEVAERVWAAADQIAARHPGGHVLVVSHGLALAALVCRARGLPLERVYEMVPENCQVEVVDW